MAPPLHRPPAGHPTHRRPPPGRTATLTTLVALSALVPGALQAAPVDDAVAALQRDWEVVRYQAPSSDRAKLYEKLAARAHEISAAFAGQAAPLVLEGVIVSSLAAERGGFSALGLAKRAKALYEQSLQIDPRALGGLACDGLGVLYFKVPGWPLAFGDKDKAGDWLRQALAVDPEGLDANFHYGEYLLETHREAEARAYLERVLKAPSRPGRNIGDTARREEARALLARLKAS